MIANILWLLMLIFALVGLVLPSALVVAAVLLVVGFAVDWRRAR